MPQVSSKEPTPGPRRLPRRALGAAVLLLFLVWAAPIFVAHSPLRNLLARRLLSELRGSVTVGSASCGWFSPVVLREVEIRDAEGKPVLAAAEVASERWLLGLACDPSDVGHFHCEGATLHVVCAAQGTNLERLLEAWLKPAGAPGPASGPGVSFACAAARVEVRDEHLGREWLLHPVDLGLQLPRDATAPVTLKLGASHADPRPGRLDVEVQVYRPGASADAPGGKGTLKVQAREMPLGLLSAALRRVEPSARVDGRLDGQLDGRWEDRGGGGLTARLEGRLSGSDLSLEAASLDPDRLHLDRLTLPCRVRADGQRVTVEQAELECDAGKVSLTGGFDLAHGLGTLLVQPGYEADADVDLARLAALAPATLRLRKDSSLAAGRLRLHLHSQAAAGGAVVWEGRVSTSDLRGVSGGQLYTWPEPIRAAFVARQTGGTLPVVEQLHCQSDFLQVDASGTTEHFTATARYDLARLSERLGQFVDFGGTKWSGSGSSQVVVTRSGQGRFQVQGESAVRQLEVAGPRGQHVREENVKLVLSAAGQADGSGPPRLDAAVLQAQSGQDLAGLELLEPIADLRAGLTGAVRARAGGDLARWRQRLAPFVGLPEAVGGNLVGWLDVQPAGALPGLKLELRVQDLVYGKPAAPGWHEPLVRLVAAGRYDGPAELLQLDSLRLETAALTCAGSGRVARLGGSQDLALSGQLTYDLEKLGPALRQYLGADGKATGGGVRPFRVEGSLAEAVGQGSLKTWVGEAALGWASLQAHGCQCGPAETRARLQNGWVQFEPIQTSLNEGKLRLEPWVRLTPAPAELVLGKGSAVERARLTPALCASALQYALPALAEMTEVEGQVSVAVDACGVPLAAPSASEVSGRVTVHSARLGPSPLLRELSVLLKGPPGGTLRRESVVSFRMTNGRVYHQGLELAFPDLTVRTEGSVGLDGSLALVAEFPVPQKWLGPGSLGQAVGKQTVRVPIGGTLHQPRLDEQALRAAMGRFAQDTARDVLRIEVEGQLNRLLRPRGNPGQR